MRVIRENVEREVDASKCEQLLKDGYKLVETSGDSKKESSEAKAPGDLDSMGLAELRAVAKEKRSFRLFQSEQRRTAWCPERVI